MYGICRSCGFVMLKPAEQKQLQLAEQKQSRADTPVSS
jgi:hypothetical protein